MRIKNKRKAPSNECENQATGYSERKRKSKRREGKGERANRSRQRPAS